MERIGFEKFAEEVREAIEKRYPDSRVELKQIQKNNGVTYKGVTISDDGEKIYPTLYLENFYKETDGEITDKLLDRICKIYEEHRITGVDLDYLSDYENIKNRLRVKLINYKTNSDRLKDIPHRKFMDLAIVPYVIVSELMFDGEATFTVKHVNLDMWDVTPEKVLDDAVSNTMKNEQVTIMSMYEMLMVLNPGIAKLAGDELKDCPMYVMTTERATGSVSMMFEDKIKEFCGKIDSDVYIIPSSVQEIILVPADQNMNEEALASMIRDVNHAELKEEDVLSDHAYYFDRKLGYKQACA